MGHPPQTPTLMPHFAALNDPSQLVKVLCLRLEILSPTPCATIASAAIRRDQALDQGGAHIDFSARRTGQGGQDSAVPYRPRSQYSAGVRSAGHKAPSFTDAWVQMSTRRSPILPSLLSAA